MGWVPGREGLSWEIWVLSPTAALQPGLTLQKGLQIWGAPNTEGPECRPLSGPSARAGAHSHGGTISSIYTPSCLPSALASASSARFQHQGEGRQLSASPAPAPLLGKSCSGRAGSQPPVSWHACSSHSMRVVGSGQVLLCLLGLLGSGLQTQSLLGKGEGIPPEMKLQLPWRCRDGGHNEGSLGPLLR